jgi:hypothetical protein
VVAFAKAIFNDEEVTVAFYTLRGGGALATSKDVLIASVTLAILKEVPIST